MLSEMGFDAVLSFAPHHRSSSHKADESCMHRLPLQMH